MLTDIPREPSCPNQGALEFPVVLDGGHGRGGGERTTEASLCFSDSPLRNKIGKIDIFIRQGAGEGQGVVEYSKYLASEVFSPLHAWNEVHVYGLSNEPQTTVGVGGGSQV